MVALLLGKGRGEGGRPSWSDLSEGVGGTFGRLTRFTRAASQELLNCSHSKAHDFKEERD